MISALTNNTTITHLDIARASLPYGASEETCQALERMFADNATLEYLDISGEDSRLESSKLGVGINRALCGLKTNTSLKCLRIQCQNLGLRGAHTLADVIKSNQTLKELYCENNSIPLSGFMDIVNALESNTTLQHLSGVEDSQHESHHAAELQIRALREESRSSTPAGKSAAIRNKFASRVGSVSRQQQPTMKPAHQVANEALEALGDLDKVWNKQIERMQKYLYRNQCIASGVPYESDGEDNLSDKRPGMGRSMTETTVSTTDRMLDSDDFDATPKVEKEVFLEDGTRAGVSSDGRDSPPTSPLDQLTEELKKL
jgi:hypothetical protein